MTTPSFCLKFHVPCNCEDKFMDETFMDISKEIWLMKQSLENFSLDTAPKFEDLQELESHVNRLSSLCEKLRSKTESKVSICPA